MSYLSRIRNLEVAIRKIKSLPVSEGTDTLMGYCGAVRAICREALPEIKPTLVITEGEDDGKAQGREADSAGEEGIEEEASTTVEDDTTEEAIVGDRRTRAWPSGDGG